MDEKKQIEELQADRESDRLIAKRLGFEVFEMWSFAGKAELGIILDSDKGIESCPHYTTSLDAASELTKAKAGKIGDNVLIVLEVHSSVQPWNCVFRDTKLSARASAPWPALAVCRAWWNWMDAKEREA